MNVSAVLIALVVALIGMHTSSANPESIAPTTFAVGNTAKIVYTAPPTGTVATYLSAADDDILLLIAYRVDWGGDVNLIVLNTRTGGTWGTEVRINGITTTPGTHVTILVNAGQNAFTITFNGKQLATFNYRINKPVAKIVYDKFSYDSAVEELAVLY